MTNHLFSLFLDSPLSAESVGFLPLTENFAISNLLPLLYLSVDFNLTGKSNFVHI